MSDPTPFLEALVRIAADSSSTNLVREAVRTAYALGKLDAVIDTVQRQVSAQQAKRTASELNS